MTAGHSPFPEIDPNTLHVDGRGVTPPVFKEQRYGTAGFLAIAKRRPVYIRYLLLRNFSALWLDSDSVMIKVRFSVWSCVPGGAVALSEMFFLQWR